MGVFPWFRAMSRINRVPYLLRVDSFMTSPPPLHPAEALNVESTASRETGCAAWIFGYSQAYRINPAQSSRNKRVENKKRGLLFGGGQGQCPEQVHGGIGHPAVACGIRVQPIGKV